MRVRTSWIGLMMLTVGCGDPAGRPGGSWERPDRDGMTLDDLACNRNGDCPEEDGDQPPNPSTPPSTGDVGDDEAMEAPAETPPDASADDDDFDPEVGRADAAEESEAPGATPADPSPSQADDEDDPDSTEDHAGTEPGADPDDGDDLDPSPEPSGDGDAQPRGQPDPGADDEAADQPSPADDPAAAGDDAPDEEAAHDREGPGDDASGDPDAQPPEGDAPPRAGTDSAPNDEDPGHRDDDCRERCDFNADCPSGQPLCVYGRCFAEGDVPFEP